jgi:hypothetical protein
MSRNLMINIFIVFALCGCKSSVKDNLMHKINKECVQGAKSPCIIQLKDATSFKWDKLYFFGAWTNSDSIKKVIRIDYNGKDVKDDFTRMLFLSENKVVYEEDFTSADNSKISFGELTDRLLNAHVQYLMPSNAIFKGEKDKGSCKDCFDYNFVITK